MNDDYERECRQQRRFETLGTDNPRCGMCGHNDDRALELHHAAGRKHDEVMVILCRNCHRAVTDDQLDHPVAGDDANSGFVAIGNFLLGLADMLRIIVEKLVEFGLLLIGDDITSREGKV